MPIIADITPEPDSTESWKRDWIISHLRYIPISSQERDKILSEFDQDVTNERMDELYQFINSNLPEPIENGLGYNLRDIHRKLKMIESDPRK